MRLNRDRMAAAIREMPRSLAPTGRRKGREQRLSSVSSGEEAEVESTVTLWRVDTFGTVILLRLDVVN